MNIENFIKKINRPNLHKLNEIDLINIINLYDKLWHNKNKTRDDMVTKIFELWSNHEIIDSNSNKIECLICYDNLTNGNNITFEC